MKRNFLNLLIVLLLAGCAGSGTTMKNPGAGGVVVSGSKYPYAKPVPGKPGYVFSPYTENTVHVDVKGFSRGTQVQDPFSNKIFLVP